MSLSVLMTRSVCFFFHVGLAMSLPLLYDLVLLMSLIYLLLIGRVGSWSGSWTSGMEVPTLHSSRLVWSAGILLMWWGRRRWWWRWCLHERMALA